MWSGYVYKIHCNIKNEDYYGSTEHDIEKRIGDHVAHAKCDETVNKCKSAQIIERDDWDYEIVEEVDYIIKTDLLIRERYYVKKYPCVNVYNPYRTHEDWQEIWAIKNKKYRSNPENVRKIKEWEQTVVDCECGRSYTQACDARHKRSEAHEYFVKHGVALGRKNPKDVIECECGVSYTRACTARHKRSEAHKYYVENGVPRPTKGQTIQCECGGKYQMKNKNQHDEGQRHKRFIDDN